eukprot:748533-Hanusia_phi.AAC.5
MAGPARPGGQYGTVCRLKPPSPLPTIGFSYQSTMTLPPQYLRATTPTRRPQENRATGAVTA